MPGIYRYTRLCKRTVRKDGGRVKSINKKLVESSTPIKMVLASGSKLYLEGVRKILEDESDIEIVAEASSCGETAERLTEVEADFLFIDNRTFNLDAAELSDLISKKGSNTKVILLEDRTKDKINLPGVEYVTKETGSLELIYIIKRAGAASSHTV